MAKKMTKVLEENSVKITVLEGSQGEMEFDINELSDDIKAKLAIFGLSSKLGDAAAGKAANDAEEAIGKVFEGLKEGKWSVRLPAAPKVSVKTIADNLNKLEGAEQDAIKEALAKLNISLPGITD